MPGGDRTGPMGMGPMTGRAGGYCAGYPVPGYMTPVPGRGGFGYGRGWGRAFGRGRGFGRGFGWRWAAYGNPYYGNLPNSLPAYNPQTEAQMLREEARAMQEELDAINQRLKSLEAGSGDSNE